jgi:hypothetical protein
VYRLASDCARNTVVKKFVEPVLELIMLDKALNNEFNREKALRIFGEMYATVVARDGHVGPDEVKLTVGGELGGGATLLRLATLHLLRQLLPDELKFGAQAYVRNGSLYNITARGEDAARLMRFLAVAAPSAGGRYLSPKFEEFVEEAKVEVRVDNIRETKSGAAADLIISVGGTAIKYNVYLRSDEIVLQFHSTGRSRVELAARLLRLVGVTAEVKRVDDGDVWYVVATTDKLATGREELRKALAELVKKAVEERWVDAGKAERWLKKLERGLVLMEGWPKYNVRLTRSGALVVIYRSTDPDSIQRETQRLREMGLKEGRHFTVKMPEEGREGYVSILKRGLAYAAWLSVYGSKTQRELARVFIELILKRAEKEVSEKAQKIVEEGMSRSSQTLEKFEKRVEVNGKTYVVKVKGGEAVEEEQDGKTLLRIRITAEVGRVEGGHIVDRVEREYAITYTRRSGNNAAVGYALARADAPGGREADAERYSALIKALTGKEPKVYRKSDGTIEIDCYEGHLDGFMRYVELADDIEEWLEKTSRRAGSSTSQL